MENIKVLKRFVRNAAITVAVLAVCLYTAHLSEEYLNNSAYPLMALCLGMLVWLLWGISRSQLEIEARQKHDNTTTLME